MKKSYADKQFISDFFSRPAAYINHNASSPLSDITGGSLSDYMQLPLEPQKTIILLFFPHAVELPKICQHT